MQLLSISAIPNQQLVTTQDGVRYTIRIFECNGAMACDITKSGTVVLSGCSIASGTPIIPYPVAQAQDGNFVFINNTQDNVYYNLFGISQFLYYMSFAELSGLST